MTVQVDIYLRVLGLAERRLEAEMIGVVEMLGRNLIKVSRGK